MQTPGSPVTNDAAALGSEHSSSAVESVEPAGDQAVNPLTSVAPAPVEIGGRDGPDPTRFGDWEKAGRCIDF